MQTVLITGGTGMVGQALTNYLIDNGYDVIVLSRSEKKSSRLHLSYAKWDIEKQYIDPEALKLVDIIVELPINPIHMCKDLKLQNSDGCPQHWFG